jgi:hypothetical protein
MLPAGTVKVAISGLAAVLASGQSQSGYELHQGD